MGLFWCRSRSCSPPTPTRRSLDLQRFGWTALPQGGGTRGGGLLTFVRQDIPFRQVQSFRRDADGEGLEALTVELKTAGRSCVTVTNVYRPPVREGDQGDLGVRALRIPQSNFVIGGDLNAYDPLWDDRQPPDRCGRHLEEWAGDNDLVCLNDGEPTRFNRATGGGGVRRTFRWCTPPSPPERNGGATSCLARTISHSSLSSRLDPGRSRKTI